MLGVKPENVVSVVIDGIITIICGLVTILVFKLVL